MSQSSSETPTVFVTSATGSQGSALCQELRQLGWKVRATTRDLGSPQAQALLAVGVHLMPGSWEDGDALRAALTGCDKLFLCLFPNFMDMNQAPQRAERIVDIAKSVGVRQAVVSTTLGNFMIEEGTKPPTPLGPFYTRHLQSMKLVEQAVIGGNFDQWTLLRPAFFMANFIEPKIDLGLTDVRDKGTWKSSLDPSSLLSLVDHVDIARFAAAAFQDPERFNQRCLGLASEELPAQEALNQLAESIGDGRTLEALFMTDEENEKAMAEHSWYFFSSVPGVRYSSNYTNIDELNKLVPGLTTFKQYLEREQEGVRKTYKS
jgi:uncharacterized protein YbjT (DUF2867 family)